MFIDITIRINPELIAEKVESNQPYASLGHIGTHFDVMDKEFPIEFLQRNAVVFDVSNFFNRDIDISDIDVNEIKKGMFVAFYTGRADKFEYGSKEYYENHPQLSYGLLDWLVEKEVSLIGLDFAGVRRDAEHRLADQKCANKGVFVIENLCNLQALLKGGRIAKFTANTYPVNFFGMSGLLCRVVAQI